VDVLLVHPKLLAHQRCGGKGAKNRPHVPRGSDAPVVIRVEVGEKIIFGQGAVAEMDREISVR
jgi:hypothetical protein